MALTVSPVLGGTTAPSSARPRSRATSPIQQAGAAADRPPRLPRPADRAAQPGDVPRAPGAGAGAGRPQRRGGGGAVRRPRQLQAGQRQLRPHRRRRPAARLRRAAARGHARHRHRRPPGRRRVPGAGADLEPHGGGERWTPRALEVVQAIEAKVRRVLETPFQVAGTEVHVGAQHRRQRCYPIDAADRDELLRNADTAMYVGQGPDRRAGAASEPAGARAAAAGADRAAATRAIDDDEFELHYQPIVDLATAGWSASRRCCAGTTRAAGWCRPGEFIPLAERTGLIEPITRLGDRRGLPARRASGSDRGARPGRHVQPAAGAVAAARSCSR